MNFLLYVLWGYVVFYSIVSIHFTCVQSKSKKHDKDVNRPVIPPQKRVETNFDYNLLFKPLTFVMWHLKNILFFSFWEVSFFKLQMPFLDPPLSMKKGLNKNSCIFMFFLFFLKVC